jgi:hypothetical protein
MESQTLSGDFTDPQLDPVRYLKFKHEIDARVAQFVASNAGRRAKVESTLKVFLQTFYNNFRGWSVVTKDDDEMRKYLISKMTAEYSELSPIESEYLLGSFLTSVFRDIVFDSSPDYVQLSKKVRRYTGPGRRDAIEFANKLKTGKISTTEFHKRDNSALYTKNYNEYIKYPYVGVWDAIETIFLETIETFQATVFPILQKEFKWTMDDVEFIYSKYFRKFGVKFFK